MDLIWQKFTEWLKELLISGIMDNVNGLFDNVNSRVAGIAGQEIGRASCRERV